MNNDIKILQGKYNYLNQNKLYSEENFRVYREEGRRVSHLFKSEILSRVRTGEFLKIEVSYRVTKHFDPLSVKISRRMGQKESTELFEINPKDKNVHYSFSSAHEEYTSNKIMSTRPHIATPAFLTSMMMTNQKRLDPVQRTSYSLINTENLWSYKGEPEERMVFAELQALEPQDIIVNKKPLKATHCKILHKNQGLSSEAGQDIFLSKHFNIPYLGIFTPDVEIRVDHMKSFDAELPSF